MRPTRLLAYREQATCSHGHTLDVWVLPRAPGAAVETLRRCPTCSTMFVLTTTMPAGASRAGAEQPDDACPNCRTPMSSARSYPERPRCRECAAQVDAWLTDGPDLPASAASTIRCWAVVQRIAAPAVDVRDIVLPERRRRRAPTA